MISDPESPKPRRLFLALPVAPNVLDNLVSISTSLAKAAQFTPVKILWVKPENIHLTLHFLGAVPESKVQQIQESLPHWLAGEPRFNVGVQGLGYFPHAKAPTSTSLKAWLH